jgi:hypothetical protein
MIAWTWRGEIARLTSDRTSTGPKERDSLTPSSSAPGAADFSLADLCSVD